MPGVSGITITAGPRPATCTVFVSAVDRRPRAARSRRGGRVRSALRCGIGGHPESPGSGSSIARRPAVDCECPIDAFIERNQPCTTSPSWSSRAAYASSVAVTLDILRRRRPRSRRAPAARGRPGGCCRPTAGAVALSGGLRLDAAAAAGPRSRADMLDLDRAGPGHREPGGDRRAAGARTTPNAPSRRCAGTPSAAAPSPPRARPCSCCRPPGCWRTGAARRRRGGSRRSCAASRRPVIVDADRMVCEDGPVTTAGAALAQSDLMLHLLRTRFGAALADAVGQGAAGRRPAGAGAVRAARDDGQRQRARSRRLTQRIEAALPRPPSVAAVGRRARDVLAHARASRARGERARAAGAGAGRAPEPRAPPDRVQPPDDRAGGRARRLRGCDRVAAPDAQGGRRGAEPFRASWPAPA